MFFLFRVDLAIWGILYFHILYRIIFLSNSVIEILMGDYFQSTDCFANIVIPVIWIRPVVERGQVFHLQHFPASSRWLRSSRQCLIKPRVRRSYFKGEKGIFIFFFWCYTVCMCTLTRYYRYKCDWINSMSCYLYNDVKGQLFYIWLPLKVSLNTQKLQTQ